MTKALTLREWRKSAPSRNLNTTNQTLIKHAGWVEWFCADEGLAKRTSSIAHLLAKINNPYLLDNMAVQLKNGYTMSQKKTLYDTVQLHDIQTGDLKYAIKINSGYETKRYVVYTGRVFDGVVFQTNDDRELGKWLNKLIESPQPVT